MGVCQYVDGNITTWFPCIQESWFMNSPELMAGLLFVGLALLMYKTRMPPVIFIASFMVLSFTIATVTSSTILDTVFFISLIPVAGMIMISISRRLIR